MTEKEVKQARRLDALFAAMTDEQRESLLTYGEGIVKGGKLEKGAAARPTT